MERFLRQLRSFQKSLFSLKKKTDCKRIQFRCILCFNWKNRLWMDTILYQMHFFQIGLSNVVYTSSYTQTDSFKEFFLKWHDRDFFGRFTCSLFISWIVQKDDRKEKSQWTHKLNDLPLWNYPFVHTRDLPTKIICKHSSPFQDFFFNMRNNMNIDKVYISVLSRFFLKKKIKNHIRLKYLFFHKFVMRGITLRD